MSRRRAAEKRVVLPDAKFGNLILTKMMNTVMNQGKKSVAERIVYGALELAQKRASRDPIDIFLEALDNVRPSVEVRSRRVGGATYQVPVDIRAERAQALSIRWIVDAARVRSEHTMRDRLAAELLEASQNRGAAIKKREDTHRMADANKAFSHYRW